MKRYLKIFLFVSFILVLIYIGFTFYKENDIKHINEFVKNDNYKIKISYPSFDCKSIDKRIIDIVSYEKEEFINKTNKIKDKKYELNIDYTFSKYKDIYSIYLRVFYYIEMEYIHKDYMIYYDNVNKRELSIEELFYDIDKAYNVMDKSINEYLVNHNLIRNNINNSKHVMFTQDGINLIIKYNNYDVINIKISYLKLKDVLNKVYFSELISLDKSALNDVEDYEIDNTVLERNIDSLKNKKLIALTFDDGPTWELTENFIKELDKRNAKVSFFMVGERAMNQEKLVKLIHSKGHTIGSHTYDHKNLNNLEDEEIEFEINYTNQILENIIGEKIKYIRPPYGIYTKELLNKFNMTFILWNKDSLDWKKKDTKKVKEYLVNNLEDGDIVLLHDLYKTTIEGVLEAIDELQKDNFAFVSIDELAKLKNITLLPHNVYRYIR